MNVMYAPHKQYVLAALVLLYKVKLAQGKSAPARYIIGTYNLQSNSRTVVDCKSVANGVLACAAHVDIDAHVHSEITLWPTATLNYIHFNNISIP